MKLKIFSKRDKPISAKRNIKGRAFISTDRDFLLPFSELRKYEIQKDSKQIKEEKVWLEESGLASRPYPPESFLTLYESNSIFWATVKQIATDVAGLGWKLLLREGEKENDAEKKLLTDFFNKPSEDLSLRKTCERVIIDWGAIGYCGLEVTRNGANKVDGLHHVPAHTLWVHTDKEKFCQRRAMKKVWFKQFGLKKNFHLKTGEEGDYEEEKRANELIYLMNYYPRNDYYGVPNILPAVGSVIGLIGIRDYNLSFFTNYGVPAYLVTLTGEWDEDAEKVIKKHLNTEIKGSENAHRTLVLQVPRDEEGQDGKIKFEPLSVDVKEGSFRVYQQVLREDILAAYSMPPYRIGINIVGKLGGSNIGESTVIYNQSVVEPLQEDLEDIFNGKIIEEGLECYTYKLKFNDMDLRDVDAEAKRNNEAIAYGKMTPNEARNLEDLGKSYPGGDRFFMGANLIEIGEADLEKRDKEQMKFMAEQEKLKKELKNKIKAYKKAYQIKETGDVIQSFTEEIKKIWKKYQKKGLFSIKFYIPRNSPLEMVDEQGKTAKKKERKIKKMKEE